MSAVTPLPNNPIHGYKTTPIEWFQIKGSDRFDYPIDYWVAVLGVHPAEGRIEFLSKWEPSAYCHYHRHLGPTTVYVLEGEHHIVEKTAHETIHKVRTPGFFARNPGGDVHMEYGGPQGAVVFFSCQAVDGKLFEVLSNEGKVLATATIDDFTSGQIARR